MLLSALVDNKQKIDHLVLKAECFWFVYYRKGKADSDVDFLVEFESQQKSYDNFMELSFYLEDLLGRKVELVTMQGLSKYIGPHILKQAEYVAV